MILSAILAAICLGLIVLIWDIQKKRKKDKEYLQEAIFLSWIRETEIQCRKSAYVHKRVPPLVEPAENAENGIKQIRIYKPGTDDTEKVLLAAININFQRERREVNIGCSNIVAYNHLERWPISGGEWSPLTLIKNELWKYFDKDPNSDSTYDFKQIASDSSEQVIARAS